MSDKIHYHGSPMWGHVDIGGGKKIWCGDVLYRDSCALVSYAHHDKYKQINKIAPLAKSLILDNGAFTFSRRGVTADDSFWSKYYSFVLAWYSRIDWFIIPDVIGGSEEDNDELLSKVPRALSGKGVPVWHSDESLDRLARLSSKYDRVCIGLVPCHKPASGNAATEILDGVFNFLYADNSYTVKIHGLAMLDGRVLGNYPFDSADSSFVATNVPKVNKKMPEVTCKLARTSIYKNKIEIIKPPSVEEWVRSRGGRFD